MGHASRFSIPNFRMPTMDVVIGNLGQPLDLETEYNMDGHKHAEGGDAMDESSSSSDNLSNPSFVSPSEDQEIIRVA